jgi:hypothetical protein
MPSISLNYGESENLSVGSPAISGRFISAIDSSDFKDGLGLVAPWGAAQLSRVVPSSSEISNMVSGLYPAADFAGGDLVQEAADSLSEFLSGLSYDPISFEGISGGNINIQLQGLQGPAIPRTQSELSIPPVTNSLLAQLRAIPTKDINNNIFYDLGKGILKLENRTFDPIDPETGRIWLRTDL